MTTKYVAGLFLLLAMVSCGRRQPSDKGKTLPVSETPPQLQTLTKPGTVLANTSVPSVGVCAPRYANGQIGTCINNQACRGLGMLDASGLAICSCYGKAGGCEAGFRCDSQKKRCVPEKQPTRERAP